MRISNRGTRIPYTILVCFFLIVQAMGMIIISGDVVSGEKHDEKGTTIYVDDDADPGGDGGKKDPFRTIQDALDVAEEFDTIKVASGEYEEKIVIDTDNLTILGAQWRKDPFTKLRSGEESIIQYPKDEKDCPRNVILFIGDGMGFEQVAAGGMFQYGEAGTLNFEDFPYSGELTTCTSNSDTIGGPDSAGTATAIATGYKVNNQVISMAYPSNEDYDQGEEMETLLEKYEDQGKLTGLVTTTYMTHATPATFGAHEPLRSKLDEIADDYLTQSRPNVLLGGGGRGMTVEDAEDAGYTVVTDRSELLDLEPETGDMISGQFGSGHMEFEYDGMGTQPHLSDMVDVALDVLQEESSEGEDDDDDDFETSGFFLMVEGGKIDHGGHGNSVQRMVHEVVEFENAIQVALDRIEDLSDTLIIVTADHETGGLEVIENNGQDEYPTVTWSTTHHTNSNIPIFGLGSHAGRISGEMDNTDLWDIITTSSLVTINANNVTIKGFEIDGQRDAGNIDDDDDEGDEDVEDNEPEDGNVDFGIYQAHHHSDNSVSRNVIHDLDLYAVFVKEPGMISMSSNLMYSILLSPYELVDNVYSLLSGMSDLPDIQQAIILDVLDLLEDCLDVDHWTNDWYLEPDQGKYMFSSLGKCVKLLTHLIEKYDLDTGTLSVVQDTIQLIVQASEKLTIQVYQETMDHIGIHKVNGEIKKCQRDLKKANKDLDKGHYQKLISHHFKAWRHGQKVLKIVS